MKTTTRFIYFTTLQYSIFFKNKMVLFTFLNKRSALLSQNKLQANK